MSPSMKGRPVKDGDLTRRTQTRKLSVPSMKGRRVKDGDLGLLNLGIDRVNAPSMKGRPVKDGDLHRVTHP